MQKEKELTGYAPHQELHSRPVNIPAGKETLNGDLTIPAKPRGLVIFAHGSGSGRKSPRNRYVAKIMNEHHLATLLADLLTTEEGVIDEQTRSFRFDIPLLARRLESMVHWAQNNPETKNMSLGLFGASTGSAAALIAAARQALFVKAVVSRGGRPDLAMEFLPRVQAPTLLIVGGLDPDVLVLNRQSLQQMNVESTLRIVPEATHLFEEPGALEKVSQMASAWFSTHL